MSASKMNWQDHVLAKRLEQASIEGDDDDNTMVIGVDFGTTFSGVSWATAADLRSDQINQITSWPGTGREEGKAPTELFYEDGEVTWGYGVPRDALPARWFKLLLLRDEDIDVELHSSEYLIRGRRMLRENNKSAEDLVADYLRLMWQHVLESIDRARGESVLEAMAFHVVITVPAIWKDYARDRMRTAAKVAGILASRPAGQTVLTFAPEPEAAALSTLCEPGRRVKKGDIYVVCDAGGGTVDLSCYEIEETEPISMREAVEGTGGLCGGIFIDEAFEAMCRWRLGDKWDRLSKAGISEIMKGDWECGIKPGFKPENSAKEYIVSIPAEAFHGSSINDTSKLPHIKNGRIHFSTANIAGAFNRSFNGIDALLEGQIEKVRQGGRKVTGIILVGGLGASPYLYTHLRNRHAKSGITILQSGGMRPRTAICRGAVIKGFLESSCGSLSNAAPISVTSTISRSNIGVCYCPEFDGKKHDQADRYWHSSDAVYRASNQMFWFVKKGENVATGNPIVLGLCQKFEEHEKSSVGPSVLYQCNDDVAPSRLRSDMKKLCRIEWKPNVPDSVLPRVPHAETGAMLKRVDFELALKPSGASYEFTCWMSGRKLGAKNVKIEYQ